MVGFVVLALCLAFSSIPAQAQTVITLAGSRCWSCFDFRVSESSLMLPMSHGWTSATAFTSGSLPIPENTTFTLSESKPILMTHVGSGLYTLAPGSGGFDIRLVASGFTLFGFLALQNLSESRHHGAMEASLWGNFDITGGTYCSLPGARCGSDLGYVKIDLSLPSRFRWFRHGHHRYHEGFDSGRIGFPPSPLAATPEPTAMLLFGTGLLVVGGVLRRRRPALIQ